MDIHMYLYSLRCSILVHNLSMQQKQEVDRPLFFFRLWSPGRMRPRRLPGSCLLTRDLHGNKHSAACYTSTVSNTPPTSVYRDECGFFAMGSNPAIQKNPNSWRDQRTNMCCFVSGIFWSTFHSCSISILHVNPYWWCQSPLKISYLNHTTWRV